MPRIDIGNVVILTGDYERPVGVSLKNKTGVVRSIDKHGRMGVEFDHDFNGGNNLNGQIVSLRGWYCPAESLTKMEPVRDVIKRVYYMEET